MVGGRELLCLDVAAASAKGRLARAMLSLLCVAVTDAVVVE